mmetsp:Transcript_2414/g.3614  ORF Transcript_2414/g.3614 Transcript_2414/m.3614 type:complete len:98 (+) Transcript_2414:174-467(+)
MPARLGPCVCLRVCVFAVVLCVVRGLKADLDLKISALVADDCAGQIASVEAEMAATRQLLKQIRRVIAFKASHGLLDEAPPPKAKDKRRSPAKAQRP